MLTRALSQETELSTRFTAAAANLELGRTAAAHEQMIRCIELARRLRYTGSDVPIAWWRFYRALDADDTVLAGELATRALDLHRRSQAIHLPETTAMVEIRLGGPGTPVKGAWLALAHRSNSPIFRAFFGHAVAEQGRLTEAIDVLGDPVPDGAWDFGSMYSDCLRVDVLAGAAPSAPLRRVLDRILPWGNEFAIFGSVDLVGSIDYFVGRGLECFGDLDGDPAAYSRAVAANRAAGVLPWLRRSEQRLDAVAGIPVRAERLMVSQNPGWRPRGKSRAEGLRRIPSQKKPRCIDMLQAQEGVQETIAP